jgi:glyoxylase-like metal-dependent hydrolase (beta-lactamase superfamily II)
MSTRIQIALGLSLLLAGSVYISGQGGPPQPSKLDLVKVKDDLFVIHNQFVPGNVTAMVTNEGVILVDDKFDVDHDNILAMLKTVTNQPVKYVINTHHHGDHSGGNAKMQAMNVQIIASERARQLMVEGNQPGPPPVTFTGRSFVHLGGKTVELYTFGRAHTAGDVFVYFPAQRVLATGDAYTIGPATPQLVDYQGGGSAKEWPNTLDGALNLDFDTVIPGHGEVSTKADLRKFRDATAAMPKRVHEMLVQKKTPEEISAVLKSEFQGAQLIFPGLLDGLLVELR